MQGQGYIEVYTGNGKGKTTAAIGLAIRALGAQKKILFMQFMKGKAYSEQSVLQDISPLFTLETSGKPFFIAKTGMLTPEERKAWGEDVVVFEPGHPPEEYKAILKNAFARAKQAAISGEYDLIVLDELNVALFFDLISRTEVEALLQQRHSAVELVFTGRNAPEWLIEKADLVTQMQEIKHYYQQGVAARKGIDN